MVVQGEEGGVVETPGVVFKRRIKNVLRLLER